MRRRAAQSAGRAQHSPAAVEVDTRRCAMRLAEIRPLEFRQVRRTPEEPLFNSLMEQHHYLGYKQPVGEHLKYLVWAQGGRSPAWRGVRRRGTWAAATASSAGRRGAAAEHPLPRLQHALSDPAVGARCRTWPRTFSAAWPAGSRRTGSASTGTRSTFWRPSSIRSGSAGTCYRAANWVVLGATTGRGKDDQTQAAEPLDQRGAGLSADRRFRELLAVHEDESGAIARSTTSEELEAVLERARRAAGEEDTRSSRRRSTRWAM